jgi:hypothetical protein
MDVAARGGLHPVSADPAHLGASGVGWAASLPGGEERERDVAKGDKDRDAWR